MKAQVRDLDHDKEFPHQEGDGRILGFMWNESTFILGLKFSTHEIIIIGPTFLEKTNTRRG
jgi:hypothetical protein